MPVKVSVIVPVYNPGAYIDECIASILSQSLPADEYEAIFVDDGSTDGTGARLDALAAEHANITAIHIPNSGWPGRPRNVGIDAAVGKYVYFVDNDDWIGDDALERLYERAERNDADVVVGKEVGHGKSVPREVFRRNVDDATLANSHLLLILTPHKLFRSSFLDAHQIRFPESPRGLEDDVFVMKSYFNARRISILSDYACYHWIQRGDSGNISDEYSEPVAYYQNVREVLDVVDEHTDPGAGRDRLYAHWYRRKGLNRLRGATWATKPDAHCLEVYSEIRKLALERFGPGVAEVLPMKFRVLSRFVHADRADLVSAQAHIEQGIRSSIALTSLEWADSRLRLSLTSALTYADGTPIALEWRDEKVYWVPPEPLAGTSTILDADRDVTTEIKRTKVAIVLRNRESLVEFEVLAKPTNPIGVDNNHVRDAQPTISLTVDADIRISTVATGSELGIGVWDLFVYIQSCGWSALRRLSAAAFPMPEPDGVIELYTTKFGNLSIKVKDSIAEVERRAAQRQAAEKQAAKNAMLTPSATSNDARGVRAALIVGMRRFLSARVMRFARPAVRRVRRLRYVRVRGQVLDARCDGDRFTLRLAGAELNTLIAKPRSGGQSLRIRPSGGNPGWDSTFSVPLHHLLPRGIAHTTLDFYREERGKEISIVSPRHFRCGRGHDHEIAALPYTTASGNLSLSLLRTVRRGPLRIVVVVHQLNFSGGKTTAMFELASVLRAAGFDVTLTALWLTSTPPVYQPPEDVTLGYIDSQMLLTPGDESLRLVVPELSASPRTIRRIGTYFSEIDADVVYLPDYDSQLYDIALDALPARVLSILGDHNGGRYSAALTQGAVPANQPRNRLFYEAIQRFDAVHIINPIVQGAYEASTPKSVISITNSVASVASVGADFLNHRRIIAAGRLTPAKGFETLIRAFGMLRGSHPEWTLDIFGQGESRELLQALIGELRLEEAVSLRGTTRSLLDEMLVSSLHVSASRFESFGLTMAEAMSVGLPVLAHHRTAGSRYLLADGRGFVAESTTVDSLAADMGGLLRMIEAGDPDGTIQRNASAARQFVKQISKEAVIDAWKTEIHRLYDQKIAALYG